MENKEPSLDRPWLEEGACFEGYSKDLFPPPGKEMKEDRERREAAAKAVCNTCVVKNQCLEYALEHEESGIWGGMTAKERKRLSDARERESRKQKRW